MMCALLAAASHAGSELFRSLSVEAAGGVMLAQGNLDGVLEPAPSGELRLGTGYYGDFSAHAFLAYSPTRARGMDVAFQAVGVGLDWGGLPAWWPRPLGGVAMYVARIGAEDDPDDRYPLLHGGESEFGSYAGLRWEWILGKSWQVSASGRWDAIFTRPAYSHLVSLQCGAGWRWQ